MLQQYLESLEGMVTYQVIAFVLFFAAFCAIVLWVVRLRGEEVERMARLPLDGFEHPQRQSPEVRP